MKLIGTLILYLVIGFTSAFYAASSFAVSLNVIDGNLYGASRVNVSGTLYDVEFLDGTCTSLYGECKLSSFTFTDPDDALAASHALADQVFKNTIFYSEPQRINGIDATNTQFADILTIYSFDSSYLLASLFELHPNSDDILLNTFIGDQDTTYSSGITYAKWTVSTVPLPAGLPLYATGLLVIGLMTKYRKRRVNSYKK